MITFADSLETRVFFFFMNACQHTLVNIGEVVVFNEFHTPIFIVYTNLFHKERSYELNLESNVQRGRNARVFKGTFPCSKDILSIF